MNEDTGGGASRSTDPAAGTSSATDVSLREFMTMMVSSLDAHMRAELEALRRETIAARESSDRAVQIAAQEATDRLAAHNGLIDQMQQQQATFVPRESFEERRQTIDQRLGRLERFQAALGGGLILLSFIGIANLVKLWS